jgi:hypothetical protein
VLAISKTLGNFQLNDDMSWERDTIRWLHGLKFDLRPKGASGPGLRRRTRNYQMTNDVFRTPGVLRVPGITFRSANVPGEREFLHKFDELITDEMRGPAPSVYHELYPGVFPRAPFRMFDQPDGNVQGLGGANRFKMILAMLRAWFRKAIRNLTESFHNTRGVRIKLSGYGNRNPRLADVRPSLLRLTWNSVLDDRSNYRSGQKRSRSF